MDDLNQKEEMDRRIIMKHVHKYSYASFCPRICSFNVLELIVISTGYSQSFF